MDRNKGMKRSETVQYWVLPESKYNSRSKTGFPPFNGEPCRQMSEARYFRTGLQVAVNHLLRNIVETWRGDLEGRLAGMNVSSSPGDCCRTAKKCVVGYVLDFPLGLVLLVFDFWAFEPSWCQKAAYFEGFGLILGLRVA